MTSLNFLLLLILVVTTTPATSDSNSDKAALQSLHSSLIGRWNLTGADHCHWQGVVCNSNRQVFELHLPGVGFVGHIPDGIFGNFTALSFLSLRFNALTGSIPTDLGFCVQLQSIYLQGNKLSGDIPPVLFTLPNLERVVLAGNRFSGAIPTGFNNLKKLNVLYLEDNQLTGEIPELNVPSLQEFNVSNNLLTGEIPAKLCRYPSSSFAGNSLDPCDKQTSSSHKKKLSAGAVVGIIIGCIIALLLLILLILFCCCRRKKDKQVKMTPAPADVEMAPELKESNVAATPAVVPRSIPAAVTVIGATSSGSKSKGIDKTLVFIGKAPRVFDLDDLLKASAEVLGKGSYGTTYKASLDNGSAMAVKRLKDVTVSEDEFREKMEEIGRLDHENLVALRAYHCSPNEKLLVYDYFSMGSLSALLHGNRGSGRTPLNWETRSAVALGTARGIAYIHSRNPTSSHGNIKSSNILLTPSYEARVSDGGLSHLATPSATPNRVVGYRAPEITDPRKVSQKADVYSFGVLILELLTGKTPAHTLLNEEGVDLPRWVQSVVREEWASEVFDLELLRYQNVEEEMVRLLQLAIDCTAQYPDSRPTMTQVTAQIEEIRSASSVADITINDAENNSSTPS